MKYLFAAFALLYCFNPCYAQLANIVVDHNGTPAQYLNLDTAIAHAANGDNLYLSGGTFSFSGNFTKSLNIYGAGFYTDSTLATLPTIIIGIGGPINVTGSNANNSMFTGIQFNTFPSELNINGSSNILFTRCKIDYIVVQNASDVSISGSIVGSNIGNNSYSIYTTYGSTPVSNFSVTNSIIYNIVYSSNATYENNVFFNVAGSSGLFTTLGGNTNNSIFRNNIFCLNSSTSFGSVSNNYYNNVFTDTVTGNTSGSLQNNIFNTPLSSIFQNVVYSTGFQYSSNFHLRSGSAAIGVGVGGTDAGIYGGSNPFKEGAVPLNPHISNISVPNNTDQNGYLHINATISAQSN